MTTFCGNAASTGHVDGLANSARFSNPESVCFDAHDGSLYVSDTDNHRIRRIAPDLRVSTRAGDGQGRHLDGHATAASFENPSGLVAIAGWVYVVDRMSNTIRAVSPTGEVTSVVGNPFRRGYKDSTGNEALVSFLDPNKQSVNQPVCPMACNQEGMVAFMAWDRNPNHERCRIRSFRTEQHTVHPAGPSTILSELGTLLDDNK